MFNKIKEKSSILSSANPISHDLSIIGSSVRITGDIVTSGSIRVDGKVEGNVTAEGNMILGDSGEIKGNVKGKSVSLGGKVEGLVIGLEKVTLEAKSSLLGDITSKTLVIEPGAFFNGKSNMGTPGKEK